MVSWMDSVERNRAELREIADLGFARVEVMIERVNGRVDSRYLDLLRWSLTFWVGTTLAMAGTLAALMRLGR